MQIEINGNKVEINITTAEAIELVQRIVANLPACGEGVPLYIVNKMCDFQNKTNGENYSGRAVLNITDEN